ncbi:MAG: polyprenyl synthetase family protein [Candidatus Cloacimonadota bacterium]|nr:MAG: polyprenyl synthetase family protein [Deltaproteobacteria bacterium]RLC53523.1 MAG: polyprenyl synthetase family protein [Candidatus Cloacimonadota bacterium]
MAILNDIKEPIQPHLEIFEKKFKNSMKSNVALLDIITRYIVKRKGKQMRPMFVFLSGGMHGEINESTYTAASLIELLHTATLVHDDVVDDSNERRGFFSINALWKNKVAVLVGDFLLSKGLLLALDQDEFQLLKIVSEATREMSEGELLQIEKARKLDISEDIYFEIIRKKTASLIASCCASGTHSVNTSKETVQKMKLFGEKVGIAFQIKDDLFDYEFSNKTGKPNGIDIKEQKMTLPLIYLLNNSSWAEKRKIINIVKNHNNNPDKVKFVIDKVNQSGGIEYTKEKMQLYHNEALQILDEFPDSDSKTALKQLVDFTIERKK